MVKFPWLPENTNFIVAVLWCAIGFASYYFLAKNKNIAGKIWTKQRELDQKVGQVILQRIWGVIFLGAASVVIIVLLPEGDLKAYGLGFSFLAPPPRWSYLIIPLVVVAVYFSAPKPRNLELYPQIRVNHWTPGILLLSGISWIAFLVGYEIVFRGLLLFASLQVMNPWAAIALNCSLYALAHFYKGPLETFGSIPVGIMFCYLTILTGNIWTAVIIHSVMSLSNEWWSIWANPEIKVKKRK